jgi:hypothetical protein
MLRRLSIAQCGHLNELRRYADRLAVVGFDRAGGPVVVRTDGRGEVTYAIRTEGEGRDVIGEVRKLTDAEIDVFPWPHLELLTSCGYIYDEGEQ